MSEVAERFEKALDGPIKAYGRLDAWERASAAEAINQALLDAQHQVANVRRSAVRELRSQGYTLKEIATELGLTIGRVNQIEQGYGRAEQKKRKNGR